MAAESSEAKISKMDTNFTVNTKKAVSLACENGRIFHKSEFNLKFNFDWLNDSVTTLVTKNDVDIAIRAVLPTDATTSRGQNWRYSSVCNQSNIGLTKQRYN